MSPRNEEVSADSLLEKLLNDLASDEAERKNLYSARLSQILEIKSVSSHVFSAIQSSILVHTCSGSYRISRIHDMLI